MSTRCMVQFHYDNNEKHGALLYHHSDGYPDYQLLKIVEFLKETYNRLSLFGYAYWWDPERVAAMFVLLSAGSYDKPNLVTQEVFDMSGEQMRQKHLAEGYKDMQEQYPVYQPALNYHGDIEFLYRVYLIPAGQKPDQAPLWKVEVCSANCWDEEDEFEVLFSVDQNSDIKQAVEAYNIAASE